MGDEKTGGGFTQREVSLGCGSLLAIAAIVLFLGNCGVNRQDIRDLETAVHRLEQAVENQSEQLRLVEQQLEALRQDR